MRDHIRPLISPLRQVSNHLPMRKQDETNRLVPQPVRSSNQISLIAKSVPSTAKLLHPGHQTLGGDWYQGCYIFSDAHPKNKMKNPSDRLKQTKKLSGPHNQRSDDPSSGTVGTEGSNSVIKT